MYFLFIIRIVHISSFAFPFSSHRFVVYSTHLLQYLLLAAIFLFLFYFELEL